MRPLIRVFTVCYCDFLSKFEYKQNLLPNTPETENGFVQLIRIGKSFQLIWVHYAKMSVQYTAIFHGCKNDNFQMKIFDFFLIFAQNIDCGYTLEPPQ